MNLIKFEGKRRSPLDAIRAFCLWCCGGQWSEVAACPSDKCAFYPYRRGAIPPGVGRSLVRIIKARCLDCMPDGAADCDAYQALEHHPPCPCWPFRMGKNPNIGSEARKKRREYGKRQMNFTAPRPESAPRIARRLIMEGMPHEG
jgi:hypothetical protein